MKFSAVTHPVPVEYAKRIYSDDKTVYVGKSHRGKVSDDAKFVLYESYGAKAYTGWADIKFIGKMSPKKAFEKYDTKIMLTGDEFKEYTKGADEINVIEFKNFEKFKNPVKPKRYVSKGGKYLKKDEIEFIIKKGY